MIPSVIARQIQRGVADFLRTTFPITNPFFRDTLDKFLETPEMMFRGPYLSVKLPFRPAEPGPPAFPNVLPVGFMPYRHQQLAFERLDSRAGLSTIVATGTGSGKTECFFYPILDYCHRQRGRRGIKAILVYPMNALASDQAQRLAQAIWRNDELRGYVSAGLYIGGLEEDTKKAMAENDVITDRELLVKSPPDILITNYKMLDYLLVRPSDVRLWKQNGPDTLRYLVVDELHSFDGAQGADLACLIRRIKKRLNTPERHLICVGTSATLGEGSTADLTAYATDVFGEPFDDACVVGESVQTTDEFLAGKLVTRFQVPQPEALEAMNPLGYKGPDEYAAEQEKLWMGESPADLSDALQQHWFLRNLLTILGSRAVHLTDLIAELKKRVPNFGPTDPVYLERLLGSFLTLVSRARVKTEVGDRPLVQVRMQLWLRELRRMVAPVRPDSVLAFADDLKPEERKRSLPLLHCRECGLTGWGALVRHGEKRLETDLRAFYAAYFDQDASVDVRFLFPLTEDQQEEQAEFQTYLCRECLTVDYMTEPHDCGGCGAGFEHQIAVWRPEIHVLRKRAGKQKLVLNKDCPACKAQDGIAILGSRAASLTSVAIAQLFASPFNHDKKLLAFSDSVQDASHRAGFFGARTYTFNLRGAIQRTVLAAGAPIPLPKLLPRFLADWKAKLSPEQFVATFLPPDMAWLEDFESLRATGVLPAGSDLPKLLDRRLDWELWSEYTFDCRIGRTLEKTSSSTVQVAAARGEALTVALLETLREKVGTLRNLERLQLEQFLAGFFQHLKSRGAVGQQDLEPYIETLGDHFHLGRRSKALFRPWRPPFKFGRAPVFLTNKFGEDFQSLLRSTSAKVPTWYEDWLVRTLGPAAGKEVEIVFDAIVSSCKLQGVLLEWTAKNALVWGLNADIFEVTPEVSQFRCNRCRYAVSVPTRDVGVFDGSPCLRFQCKGALAAVSSSEEDYYRSLYESGDMHRVFVAEHTGLLKRETRELIEDRFRHNEKPGDPNLLSCTPTLEMGINIGDLSSLALCSVPPKPSNYLQRVGRAGRVDGNSFILTVANGRPHDLFFYFEPEEMIQGLVETPGCFLNASAVLQRQFTAYVFDRWAETGVPAGALPSEMRTVLDAIESGGKHPGFPTNILSFFQQHRTALEDGFLAMFGTEVQDSTRDRIRAFSDGKSTDGELGLEASIHEGMRELIEERKSLGSRIDALTRKVRGLKSDAAKSQSYDEDLKNLLRERAALSELRKSLNERIVLNFFTDEGLLPNYAFPEAGVVLRSVIYRVNTRAEDDDKKYKTNTYEYERPASAAIHELAPANSFYAEGRRLVIDQVNLQLSAIHPWRFCNNCSYLEREGQSEPRSACARCGSPLWSDPGQLRSMLRMRQVISTASEQESRSHDESDDREPLFYQRNVFVTKEDSDITAAFAIDKEEVPFGFEFFRKVMLREVNLGEDNRHAAAELTISGRTFKENPFQLCGSCGKVKKPRQPLEHALYCRYHGKAEEARMVDACFLYREFKSEAIRILLPVASFEVDKNVGSFVAAMELGLRRKFRGDPGHLLTTLADEPIPGSDIRKQFLVLYDGVPGGTGYLKELMQAPESLMEVFERAYEVLRKCRCQSDPQKDGCYRCLLAYRGRHDASSTSRRAAMELLELILENRQHLKQTKKLDTIGLNRLLESMLERQFIEGLRRLQDGEPNRTLEHQVVNGKPGFYLKFDARAYRIEPQVDLGDADGVREPSRVDFVFYPERPEPGELPVAIFTDGFEFHADPSGNLRVGLDTAQRMSIVRSGRFRVWSLTWADVMEQSTTPLPPYSISAMGPGPHFQALLAKLAGPSAGRFRNASNVTSFALLLNYLASGSPAEWERAAQAFAGSLLEPDLKTPSQLRVERQTVHADGAPLLRADGRLSVEAIRKGDYAAMTLRFELSDSEAHHGATEWRKTWRDFLWLFNFLQFLRSSEFVTSLGLAEGRYGAMEETLTGPDASGALLKLLDLAALAVHPLCRMVAKAGRQLPEPGYELAAEDGEVIAEAELAWPTSRVAVLLPERAAERHLFEDRGWRTFSAEQDVFELLKLLPLPEGTL